MKRYATIRRGKIKFEIGSKQDRLLHFRKLPHTHVRYAHGKKIYKRYYPK